MKTSEKGIGLIKSHEQLRLKAYLCPAGVWTIGYGHTRNVKKGDVITEEQAEQFLREDLMAAEAIVNKTCRFLNQNQFDALVSFAFNVGSGNFAKSTLLKKVQNDSRDIAISAEFAKWVFAKGVKLNGLVNRRKQESSLYFSM